MNRKPSTFGPFLLNRSVEYVCPEKLIQIRRSSETAFLCVGTYIHTLPLVQLLI